jgi:hypothetical protein
MLRRLKILKKRIVLFSTILRSYSCLQTLYLVINPIIKALLILLSFITNVIRLDIYSRNLKKAGMDEKL